MNIPLSLQCNSCKAPYDGTVILGASHVDWNCTKCGTTNYAIPSLDFTIGPQIWVKASYELNHNKDFSMTVVLAAAAIDGELSSLFCKWTGIAQLAQRGHLLTDEECEELLLKIIGIGNKFKDVSKLLVPDGFQHYVSTTPRWRDMVSKEAPELDMTCLIKCVEKEVFWPRNRILHGGTPATAVQAELALRVARVCLEILLAMDYERRKAPIP
jgi:hypothetical protein